MKIIVITYPTALPDEHLHIEQMLSSGQVDRIHLRRPYATETKMRRLIESISPDFYDCLSVHDHFDLAVEYNLGGIHLNSRSNSVPEAFHGLISASCHSVKEAINHNDKSYLFLSPVFDSISKNGYKSAISIDDLTLIATKTSVPVYALGGVTPDRIPVLAATGIYGAAILGAAWLPQNDRHTNNFINELKCFNS